MISKGDDSVSTLVVDKKRMKDIMEMAVIMTEKENPTMSEVAVYTGHAHQLLNNIDDVLSKIASGEFQRNMK